MTLVPAVTPVTNPVLLTVATAGVADTHGLTAAAVPLPVNWVVPVPHTVKVPVIVTNSTVTVAVCWRSEERRVGKVCISRRSPSLYNKELTTVTIAVGAD